MSCENHTNLLKHQKENYIYCSICGSKLNRLEKYNAAWNYYIKSRAKNGGVPKFGFNDYMRILPEHEIDRMVELNML